MLLKYVRNSDKISLVTHLNTLYRKKFEWAPEELIQSLVDTHFYAVINDIDHDEYMKDIDTMNPLN